LSVIDRISISIHFLSFDLDVKLLSQSTSSPPIDALVFSGGIGENSSLIRSRIVNAISRVSGTVLDEDRNVNLPDGVVSKISKDQDSGLEVLVAKTDEERFCAESARSWARWKEDGQR
jgi:acetate kinase